MRSYQLYIFDLDGTIYRGDDPIPHAAEVVAELRARGAKIRYVTNNSGRTQAFFAEKLSRMGMATEPHEVVSSGVGTAAYCVDKGFGSVIAVGEPGLVVTLREKGIRVLNAKENGVPLPLAAVLPVDAVVAGICRHFDYALMDSAMQHLRAGAAFVATNRDATFPMEAGRMQPGAGSIVSAIETCSGVSPFVVGKPNPFLINWLMADAGVAASDTLVVGDRIDTDIDSGKNAGCETFLVLTGVETAIPEGQYGSEDLLGLLAN